MKKIFLPVLFVLSVLFIPAQSQVAIKWQKSFGGSALDRIADDSNYYDSPDHAVVNTASGGVAFTGMTASSDGDLSANYGLYDFAIFNSDSSGNLLWSKNYGGSGDDQATSIVQTTDGGFAICGFSQSSDNDIPANYGSYDIVVLKTDASGNLQWAKNYGGSNEDRAYSFYQTSDHGFVVAGFSSSSDHDLSSNHGDFDYWIFKIDSTGNIVWTKEIGGTGRDWVNGLAPTASGGSVVCGFSFSNDYDFTNSFGGSDYWVVNLDDQGNIIWMNNYGGAGNDWAFDITPTYDGGYALCGLTEGTGGQVTNSFGGHDYWIIKIDAGGNLVWQHAIGGLLIDECYEIVEDVDHGLLVAGTSNSSDHDVPGNYGILDYYVIKVDEFGNLLWTKTYGGTQSDWALSMTLAANGDYYIFGNSKSSDHDVTANHGDWDLWMLCLTSNYNTISGYYYYDVNQNGMRDTSDVPITHALMKDGGNSIFAFTDSTGFYKFEFTSTGNYVVYPQYLPNFVINPGSYNINVSVPNTVDTGNDFIATPVPGVNDLESTIIPLTRFRPGFPAMYLLTITNMAGVANNGTMIFIPDPALTFDSASVAPDSIINGVYYWYNVPLDPLGSFQVIVYCTVSQSAQIGQAITSNCNVDDGNGITDINMKDNYASWTGFVTASSDPNDKSVSVDKIFSNQFTDLPYLDYLIHFQNVGNDTAFNITIRDTLSSLLDMNSFHVISSSSPADIQWNAVSRELRFVFNHILLPDSTTDSAGSNGYIHYRIQPVSNLVVGTQIDNTAAIYFDFNQPVITNTATTALLLDDRIPAVKEGRLSIFPSPAHSYIRFDIPADFQSSDLNLYVKDIHGRNLIGQKIGSGRTDGRVEIENLPSGIYLLELRSGERSIKSKFIKN